MKHMLLFSFLFLLSFRADQQTATLKFTKEQYSQVQASLIDVFKTIDSIKVVLHYQAGNDKINVSMARAQNQLIAVSNFIGQIDSVFNKK